MRTSIALQQQVMLNIVNCSVQSGSKAGVTGPSLSKILGRSVGSIYAAIADLIHQEYPIINLPRLGGYILMRNDKATRKEILHRQTVKAAEIERRARTANKTSKVAGEKLGVAIPEITVKAIEP